MYPDMQCTGICNFRVRAYILFLQCGHIIEPCAHLLYIYDVLYYLQQ